MTYISVGIDEVGRGALAGPVVVAAATFLLDEERLIRDELQTVLKREIADSKKLTRLQRERASEYLTSAIIWGIGEVPAHEVDSLGLTKALKKAAGLAIATVEERAQISGVSADAGLFHPFEDRLPTERIIKGDEKILAISCASIIAKVYRDNLMRQYALQHPEYGWEHNVGYGSAMHRASIQKHGATSLHRISFISNI